MLKQYLLITSLLVMGLSTFAQVPCENYLNNEPLLRTNDLMEEHLAFGITDALGQRFDSLEGVVTGVRFWARVNPSSSTANTVNVICFKEVADKPGPNIANVSIVVDSSSTMKEYTAYFTLPVTLTKANYIFVIAPDAPSTDDFFVQTNDTVDGGENYDIVLMQSGVWYGRADFLGNPEIDKDALIMPITDDTIVANFTSVMMHDTATFTSTSNAGSPHHWNFGDGNTSTSRNPVHVYGASGFYNVILSVDGSDTTCFDTATELVGAYIDGISRYQSKPSIGIWPSATTDILYVKTPRAVEIEVLTITGVLVRHYSLKSGDVNQINVSDLNPGVYLIHAPGMLGANRFIKL